MLNPMLLLLNTIRRGQLNIQAKLNNSSNTTLVPSISSLLSLCAPSALTLAGVPIAWDPTKAMAMNSLAAANNLKGLAPTSFLSAAQPASASPRPPISAPFSYMSLLRSHFPNRSLQLEPTFCSLVAT